MLTKSRRRFVYAQTAWMLAATVLLALIGVLTPTVFFVASFMGFVIVVELTSPTHVEPGWRRQLRPYIAAGLAVFVAVVLLEVLPRATVGNLM